MSRITNAKIYLGSTKQRERYKVYIVGQRGTRGTKEVWIEAGAGAKQPPMPGWEDQRDGFDTPTKAVAFAHRLFPKRDDLIAFLDQELNPVGWDAPNAPRKLDEIELRT